MPPLYKKLAENTFFRYVFIGGLSYLVELSILYGLNHVLGLNTVLSVTISFWIGLTVSFLLQKIFAFKNKTVSTKRLMHQSVAYGILIAINYFFTLTVVSVLASFITLFGARTLALIITTTWNFIVYSKIIFKK